MTEGLSFTGWAAVGRVLRALGALLLVLMTIGAVIDPAAVSVLLAESYEQGCALFWQLAVNASQ